MQVHSMTIQLFKCETNIILWSGQYVDGPQYGEIPSPWQVEVQYPPKFTDTVQKVRVPHTSSVKVLSLRILNKIFFTILSLQLYIISQLQCIYRRNVCGWWLALKMLGPAVNISCDCSSWVLIGNAVHCWLWCGCVCRAKEGNWGLAHINHDSVFLW